MCVAWTSFQLRPWQFALDNSVTNAKVILNFSHYTSMLPLPHQLFTLTKPSPSSLLLFFFPNLLMKITSSGFSVINFLMPSATSGKNYKTKSITVFKTVPKILLPAILTPNCQPTTTTTTLLLKNQASKQQQQKFIFFFIMQLIYLSDDEFLGRGLLVIRTHLS